VGIVGRQLCQIVRSSRARHRPELTVASKAQDPDVRSIAEDAEARLIRDNIVPGYRQWPSPPPPGGPGVAGYAPSDDALKSPLHSPSNPLDQTHIPASRIQPRAQPSAHPLPSSDPLAHPPPVTPTHPASYTSPYTPVPLTSPSSQNPPAPIASASTHPALPPIITNLPNFSNGSHQPASTPLEPQNQPTVTPVIVRSKSRETKILLSLDGDGIRGLSQVLLVESLMNAVCTKIGVQIDPYQVFDLIGGTSMGGILAIMLSRLRMQAHRAREAYKLIAKEVFPNKRDFFTSFDPLAVSKSHDGQAIENVIKAVVAQEVGNQNELLLDPRDDSADV
jgi:hypothetical protein